MQKTWAVLILSCAGLCCAQERKASERIPEPADKKRLASVTWDLKNHKLVWTVEKGTMQGSEFVAAGSDRYEISPDDAVMQFASEKRGFAEEEAVSLHRLLDTLSVYCAESVIWWDQGEGTKIDPKQGDQPKREKVDRKTKQKRQVNPGELVAGLESAIAQTLR